MKRLLFSASLALLLHSAPPSLRPAASQSYPVDCAILLCLAGGWPASAPCAHARAVFIRRITPFPIEPPLQIWRCPMSVAYGAEPASEARILRIAAMATAFPHSLPGETGALLPPGETQPDRDGLRLYLAEAVGTGADIDISDPAFDFVRSIVVWDLRFYRHRETASGCEERYALIKGTYDRIGQFRWKRAEIGEAPPWVLPSRECAMHNNRRGVGVEWTDQSGTPGTEWVSY